MSRRTREAQRACDECLARPWLLSALASRLEPVRGRIEALLELDDQALIAAVRGEDRVSLGQFDPDGVRERCAACGSATICRCDADYPARLKALPNPPAVLHVCGGLERFLELAAGEPVAIVGARKASEYGLEVARSLARGLDAAGVPVVSGMALGVDAAAHAGALSANGATIAVLPGPADRPYPASKRSLHCRICDAGACVSELAPGSAVWRWAFPARNRIIAALAAMTVVVEAGPRSGSLVTARIARTLGRPLGAVPGRVTSPLASGPNALLATGAQVVRDAGDVLDHLFGAGVRPTPPDVHRPLDPALAALLAAIGDGLDTAAALARASIEAERGLAALGALELSGHVRRDAGGRYTVTLAHHEH